MIDKLNIKYDSIVPMKKIWDKIDELIDVVNLYVAHPMRTLDTKQEMKFGECCKICGKELSLNQCEHTKQEKCLHADVGYPICPNCKQSVAGTGTMGEGKT